jgi:transcriptional regulator with XRE-family HTH domain
MHKARKRSADFNRRYGAAIRKVREEAGIPQAKVEGITDRQLRRIEQGECRASLKALRHLAKAHGLDVNDYMEKVAKAMS